ncbi:hypothetical protein M430DRAFT_187501 [Amorphotheca resinae ATCC 22711]|uniref:Zinc-ribbon 15 domain-containing protein n=1 Tax=Amorphotheca resinae ATCC 22711 TaxID=857342 RepID=A0A2T3AQS4_AMORE|nr:hypothetical protein M430DRAFT_187501 [Amorphotheca resinae ATCC 22711]PSS08613.1 hypothetical protein M430DRAFT_187501 [Amorphotheca resinae ATCC 22711]
MCIVFTCGQHEFSSQLQGAEGLLCQCHNCGNWSASVVKRHPWFTFCFVPVLPLSIHGYEDVICSICNFAQPLANRGDVLEQMRLMQQNGGALPLQNRGPPPGPPQGWGGGPPKEQPHMQYG